MTSFKRFESKPVVKVIYTSVILLKWDQLMENETEKNIVQNAFDFVIFLKYTY
jgi:hypothetical protein